MIAYRKRQPYISLVNSYLIDSPQPSSINYWYNLGSLLGLCLVIQIASGVFLAMHYSSHIELAFDSVEHIMRDVNLGWLIRYIHANGASFFFGCMYIHVGKALYYGSYRKPRVLVWIIGVIILIATMATGFMGYCLVYGQMSHWGATVITNLLSAIPFIGADIVPFIWGGFKIEGPYYSDIILKILLDAGKISIIMFIISGVLYKYVFDRYLVKINTTRNQSAVVKNKKLNLLVATQRLNARNLYVLNNKVSSVNDFESYFVGLIEGDGCFSITKKGKYLTYELNLEMSIRDIQLLYKIKKILGIGVIKERKSSTRNTVIYSIRNKKHLKEIILPIFDKYPMLTYKEHTYRWFRFYKKK